VYHVFFSALKEKKRKTTQAAKPSLHQLRKRRHIDLKCRESPPPKEKKTSGDLEGALILYQGHGSALQGPARVLCHMIHVFFSALVL
jgi:hypothetical protein